MKSRWVSKVAEQFSTIDLRVYSSRLLGADPALVLLGGGNTSVKHDVPGPLGGQVRILSIKGSGSDLASIDSSGFAPLLLDELLPLRERSRMDDETMVELVTLALINSSAPRPSIESLLHAFIPLDWVDHSHADAILTLTNQPDGEKIIRDVFGNDVGVVPYIKPGFDLSKAAADVYEADKSIIGLVLDKHGLVTFGPTAQESYERHAELVSRAEARISRSWKRRVASMYKAPESATQMAMRIRGGLSRRRRMIVRFDGSAGSRAFVDRDDIFEISQQGPATPDHVLRTKRLPMLLLSSDPDDVLSEIERYEAVYSAYVKKYDVSGDDFMHDPSPRVVLVPGLGLFTSGRTVREANGVAEIYRHTMDVIEGATAMSEYVALDEPDLFEIEYWPLELYKLRLNPPDRELDGRVAVVSGAAGGIGKSIAHVLAEAGAHVFVTDVDLNGAEAVAAQIRDAGDVAEAALMDVTDEGAVEAVFKLIAMTTGGVDIAVSNAGIAQSSSIDTLSLSEWKRSLEVNATGHFLFTREAVRSLRAQGIGGSVVLVCTKNTFDPGRDFGAYSAAKAAELQLGRVLAIENGEHGIRVNMVNPDAVFEDSKLWNKTIRLSRASAHGVKVDELEDYYRDRNLLRTRVSGLDVAQAVLFLASDRSPSTTGAVLPVDGGVRGAFPR